MEKIKNIGLITLLVGFFVAWLALGYFMLSQVPQAADNYAKHVIERGK